LKAKYLRVSIGVETLYVEYECLYLHAK